MVCVVIDVIDGHTFRISPKWKFLDETGNTIKANGYIAPEPGDPRYLEAKEKLERLILDKEVILSNRKSITDGRLHCDVFIGGRNLAGFFPEYR